MIGFGIPVAVEAALSAVARLCGRYVPRQVDEEPNVARKRTVYLVGEGGDPWFAVFGCPCGCGDLIKLSLLPNERPRWSARGHWTGTVSLAPSVWRQVGCKSHFWMRKGRIRWC